MFLYLLVVVGEFYIQLEFETLIKYLLHIEHYFDCVLPFSLVAVLSSVSPLVPVSVCERRAELG